MEMPASNRELKEVKLVRKCWDCKKLHDEGKIGWVCCKSCRKKGKKQSRHLAALKAWRTRRKRDRNAELPASIVKKGRLLYREETPLKEFNSQRTLKAIKKAVRKYNKGKLDNPSMPLICPKVGAALSFDNLNWRKVKTHSRKYNAKVRHKAALKAWETRRRMGWKAKSRKKAENPHENQGDWI